MRAIAFSSLRRGLLFAVVFSAYTKVLGKISGIGTTLDFFRIELPLIVATYAVGYVLLRHSRFRPYIAAIPPSIFYLIHDLYYIWFGQVFRVVEIRELPELLTVLNKQEIALFFIPIVAPLLLFLFFLDWRRSGTAVVLAAILLIVDASSGRTSSAVVTFVEKFGTMTAWSDQRSARDTGRLTMMVYHEAKRHQLRRTLLANGVNGEYSALVEARNASLQSGAMRASNVHLIVLESFLDPTLFNNVAFSSSPVHPEFAGLFAGKEGTVRSPVFGGRTCQAEFEALCGVPAFAHLSSVEFNLFTGRQVACLPALLARAGYETIASNAYKPDFFNTLPAYRSLGFQQIYFPREYASGRETYLSTGDVYDETFMFDGTLLEQNLTFIASKIDKRSGPIFNYVLGIYGHSPHAVAQHLRPPIVEAKGAAAGDVRVNNYVNQYYYRTEAVARYVKRLMSLDPNGLIVIMSDHLPPLSGGPKVYAKFGYLGNIEDSIYYNRMYVVENGVATKYGDIAHYDIPDLVLNYLSNGTHCRSNACNVTRPTRNRQQYFAAYTGLITQAVQ